MREEMSLSDQIKEAETFVTDWHKKYFPKLYERSVKKIEQLKLIERALNEIPKIEKP